MIDSLEKLKKKAYIQCGLAILLTGIFLYLTSSLWLSRNIIVSFEAEAVKDINYQVFYTEEKGQNHNGNQSVRRLINSGSQRVEIALPIKKIVKFRLDIGSFPGKVTISDLRVKGSKNIKLDYNEFGKNQINSYEIKGNSVTLSSSGSDPYLWYKKDLNLPAGYQIDWYRLIIISVLAYLFMYKFVQYLSRFKLEKQYSRIDIVMLAVFFGILCLPMSYISDAAKSEQENRMLAKKPQLMITGGGIDNFGVQFDAWYNDHFFGRDAMIYLYNYIRFYLSPKGFNKNAIIGKDGWLFLRSRVKIYTTDTLYPQAMLDKMAEHIINFVDNAKKSGVKDVYFLLSNDKETIYPEYFPDYVKNDIKVSYIEQLIDYMNKHYPDIKIFNFKKKLEELKKDEVLFFKTGTHMNNIGAYYEYNWLTNEIKKDYPELNILTLNDFDITVSDDINQPELDLDIYRNFTVIPNYDKENFKNKILKLKSQYENNVKITDVLEENPIRTFRTRKNNTLPYKLSATFISDSFGRRYENYLPHTFSKISHLFIGGAKPFEFSPEERNYILHNISDIMIIETSEVLLRRFRTLEFPKNPNSSKKEN